jgi:hypothetical protein
MPYIYKPLNKIKKQIRLITLLPGPQSSDIRCILQIVELDLTAKPHYEALSYEWGSPGTEKDISLDGIAFSVRKNLWSALYHLRQKKISRIMWIDALCIDQSNVLERNHQVGMMGDIYRNAHMVNAWLGEATPESPRAFRKIKRAAFLSEAFRMMRVPRFCVSRWEHKQFQKAMRRRTGIEPVTHASYWSRVWIIQECVLADKLLIHLGELELSCSPAIYTVFSGLGTNSPLYCTIVMMNISKVDLLAMMKISSHAGATDPRDRVYALLGMAADEIRGRIPVDYTISLEDLKARLLKMWLSDNFEDEQSVKSDVLEDARSYLTRQIENVFSVPVGDTDYGIHGRIPDGVFVSAPQSRPESTASSISRRQLDRKVSNKTS